MSCPRAGGARIRRKAIVLVVVAVALLSATQANASPPAARVVEGLLCIHDGHHYTYTGHGDPYRIRNYTQGAWTGSWGEGSWTDHGPVDWGGLQMDASFQHSYGPEYVRRYGTADRWPTWVQLRVGARAVASRGYSPWPATRVPCGL